MLRCERRVAVMNKWAHPKSCVRWKEKGGGNRLSTLDIRTSWDASTYAPSDRSCLVANCEMCCGNTFHLLALIIHVSQIIVCGHSRTVLMEEHREDIPVGSFLPCLRSRRADDGREGQVGRRARWYHSLYKTTVWVQPNGPQRLFQERP